MYKLLIVVLTMIFCCSGCGDSRKTATENKTKPLKIVTTIFPEYDWLRNVMGDEFKNAQVTLLLNKGTDLHSYQPTVQDMLKVADADLFIYVGGESDFWVKDALKEAKNKNMKVINLLEVLGRGAKIEEKVEGMEGSEAKTDGHGAHSHESEEKPEVDEHVWLSLKNAQLFSEAIAKSLSEIDGAHQKTYAANLKNYRDKLTALDKSYQQVVKGSKQKTILLGDRFPFRYLVDDYGLKYYAAFVGCSAETEASFKTVSFLAGKLDSLQLPVIFTLEKSNRKIAQTIVATTQNKKQEILTLDSMQSTTSEEIAKGATYLGIMESNLKALEKALR